MTFNLGLIAKPFLAFCQLGQSYINCNRNQRIIKALERICGNGLKACYILISYYY